MEQLKINLPDIEAILVKEQRIMEDLETDLRTAEQLVFPIPEFKCIWKEIGESERYAECRGCDGYNVKCVNGFKYAPKMDFE